MNTSFLLMAQYQGLAIIPVEKVVQDYFSHLTPHQFVRKVAVGDINIPMVRIDPGSQKAAKGIHIGDLATYIDARRAAAQKEAKQLAGASA